MIPWQAIILGASAFLAAAGGVAYVARRGGAFRAACLGAQFGLLPGLLAGALGLPAGTHPSARLAFLAAVAAGAAGAAAAWPLTAGLRRLGKRLAAAAGALAAWTGAAFLIAWNSDLVTVERLIRTAIDAAVLGAPYALVAVGYTMVYGVIKLINFAHGEVYMFGAYLALVFVSAPGTSEEQASAWRLGVFLWIVFGLAIYAMCSGRLGRKRAAAVAAAGGAVLAVACGLAHGRVPFLLAVPLAMAVAALMGVAIEFAAYRPLRNAPRLAALITAIGMSILLANAAMLIWSPDPRSFNPRDLPAVLTGVSSNRDVSGLQRQHQPDETSVPETSRTRKLLVYPGDPGIYLTLPQMAILAATVVTLLLLEILVHRTRVGRAMRAVSEDRATAALMGVDVDRVVVFTFAVGSALAALGGALNSVYLMKIDPNMGAIMGIMAFAAAVLGGIGSVTGAALGAVLLGLAQSLAVNVTSEVKDGLRRLLDPDGGNEAAQVWVKDLAPDQWIFAFGYLVMILFILFRPQGVMNVKGADRA
jgi:branched-chain amino acid transport system permease protein